MFDNFGIRSPDLVFGLLPSVFPFRPLLLGFGEDPGDTFLRILAFDACGGLPKPGTRACHVYQAINLGPTAVRGPATGCVIGGADVVVNDLATRVEAGRRRTGRGSEFCRGGSEGEVVVGERFDEGV